ncbi:hypothetical protein IG631_22144 [Alternaria alternata]|nr:hypothetical protein IG631_22144 [Alternaria alternata]
MPFKIKLKSIGPKPMCESNAPFFSHPYIRSLIDSRLDAYYTFLHPCFPVLPPAVAPHPHDQPHSMPDLQSQNLREMNSPLTFAIAALLAMVPSYETRQEVSDTSSRCELAHALSKSALQKIDDDMEMTSLPPRQRLHPDISPNLEGILALFFSALYEYCHRGNISKTRKHLASAIAAAMDADLHNFGPSAPEAVRRSWWMITYFANQLSIMHALPPLIKVNDPCLRTPYPHCEGTFGTWRSLLRAQFVHLTFSTRTEIEEGIESFKMLEATLASCVHDIDQPHTISLLQSSDMKAIYNWNMISRIAVHSARIKLYRAAAFADVPVFVDRHCDMAAIGIDQHKANSPKSPESIVATVSSSWSALEQSDLVREEDLSRSCLSSALAVIRLFRKLTRSQKPALDYSHLDDQDVSQYSWPLTVPLLACSAMQACYVLVATLCQMRASTGLQNLSILDTERTTEEIRHGIETTMKIYSLYDARFAWIKAMYDELKGVYMVAFADNSL